MTTLANRLEWTLQERRRQAAAGERITKAGLARACGIKEPSVHAWFSGATAEIVGKNLLAAAAYLNVSPQWLQTGRGPVIPKTAAETVKSPSLVRWPFESFLSQEQWESLTEMQRGAIAYEAGRIAAAMLGAGSTGQPTVQSGKQQAAGK